jgi:hypothetical protein
MKSLYILIFSSVTVFNYACNSGETKTSTVVKDTVQQGQPVSVPIVTDSDSLIISERIKGPADILDQENGKLLFRLNDNVPVTTTLPEGKWVQVGLFAELTESEYDCSCIKKGSSIRLKGRDVGTAMEDLKLEVSKSTDGLRADLVGFTLKEHIRENTIPEFVLQQKINNTDSISLAGLQPFIRNFSLEPFEGLLPGFAGYSTDETWIESASVTPRIWLIFEKDRLRAVIHSRPLSLEGFQQHPLQYGLQLSARKGENEATVRRLIQAFGTFMKHAG